MHSEYIVCIPTDYSSPRINESILILFHPNQSSVRRHGERNDRGGCGSGDLKIDIRTASILVLPKPDEVNDTNMPRNLHNAAELFLRAGMIGAAEAVRDDAGRLMDLYADNPDGKKAVNMGKGCVCWSCGHCGLPSGGGSIPEEDPKAPPGPCAACGETEQVNWLRVTNGKKGSKEELPWLEEPPLSEEERKKKEEALLAAKRKEVEARVKEAVEERARNEAES